MADLSTKYLGLTLKNPIIVGSSSLTSTIESIRDIEKYGAAAIVLKSLFEEEIYMYQKKQRSKSKKAAEENPIIKESSTLLNKYISEQSIKNYLSLIKQAKEEINIPVIASINCISEGDWISFAKEIEGHGADALELSLYMDHANLEETYLEDKIKSIVSRISNTITIPIALKLSYCYTHPGKLIIELSRSGITGLVLFNRYYIQDICIDNVQLNSGRMISNPDDYLIPLRWISMFSDKIKCSIAASSGIHDSNTVIKQLLAGADAVEIVSTLYLNGKRYLKQILTELEEWMMKKSYFSISDFKGKAAYRDMLKPIIHQRFQYLKHYGRISL
jgi:dihydroorotate dehydrogenase (fumarate)